MDSALRMALNDGLAEKADQEIVNGSDGLLSGTNLPDHNTGAVTTFANYIARFAYARVDGRYAVADKDVRSLVGSDTYGHMGSSTYQTHSASKRARLVEGPDGRRSSFGACPWPVGKQARIRDSVSACGATWFNPCGPVSR